MDYLALNQMEFHAYHGVLEQEQTIGNTYLVDLKIFSDFSKACQSDQLEDTINYASVSSEIGEEMKKSCRLIEHLAENICRRLKASFPLIQSLEIKVTKINPPMRGQLESVSIVLFR